MSGLGIPVDLEKSELSASLNGSILQIFTLGMYTVVYFGTMYIYLTRNSSKNRLVPATVTLLYLTNVIGTGIQWYTTKWQFIDNGDTRDSVFVALYDLPVWTAVAVDTPTFISFVLADGLLMWRCFFVWDRSYRVISVPLLLVITEAGLFLSQIILHGIYLEKPVSPALAVKFNNMIAAAFFLTFATTLLTTILIAYRIYSVTKEEGISARRFKHTIDIVVQSGAVNSLILLATAISATIIPENAPNTRIYALNFYVQSLVFCISGLSVTIMVARVSLISSNTTFASTAPHLSGLQFRARSTHNTETQGTLEDIHSVGRRSICEEQKVDGVV